jgi:hypothetical protein
MLQLHGHLMQVSEQQQIEGALFLTAAAASMSGGTR